MWEYFFLQEHFHLPGISQKEGRSVEVVRKEFGEEQGSDGDGYDKGKQGREEKKRPNRKKKD